MPWYVWLTLYAASLYVFWRMVKAGADEDARRDAIRRHVENLR